MLNRSDGNRGRHPTVTYYNIRFLQLGKATSKSALTTTMISGSNAVGELIPPNFQFQTSAQTAKAEAIWIEMLCYMLDVWATFCHKEVQSFPIFLGLNNKGGIYDDNFSSIYKILL